MQPSVSRTSRKKNEVGEAAASRPAGEVRSRAPLVALWVAAAVAYGADRVTKLLAERHLAGHPPSVLVPGVLHLNFTTNTGGAFGLFGGQSWLFFGATIVASVVIIVMSPRVRSIPTAIGMGLILGGALGNLTDRLIHGPFGSGAVVDFIQLPSWPIFNLADSSIVLGAIIIVAAGLFAGRRGAAPGPSPA